MSIPPEERKGYAGLLPAKTPVVALLPACVREPREYLTHTTDARLGVTCINNFPIRQLGDYKFYKKTVIIFSNF